MFAAERRNNLLALGKERIRTWCAHNSIDLPPVKVYNESWRISACAYYRPIVIHINVPECALPGYAGRAWSWPGYVIDRTPYGVLAHELGHHVDWTKSIHRGAYFGDFSYEMRKASGEERLTNYCPNDAEWFAEMFRLFVTNPDLLFKLRPRTFNLFRDNKLEPIRMLCWRRVLEFAPPRTIAQAEKKIQHAFDRRAPRQGVGSRRVDRQQRSLLR